MKTWGSKGKPQAFQLKSAQWLNFPHDCQDQDLHPLYSIRSRVPAALSLHDVGAAVNLLRQVVDSYPVGNGYIQYYILGWPLDGEFNIVV